MNCIWSEVVIDYSHFNSKGSFAPFYSIVTLAKKRGKIDLLLFPEPSKLK